MRVVVKYTESHGSEDLTKQIYLPYQITVNDQLAHFRISVEALQDLVSMLRDKGVDVTIVDA